MELGIIGCIRFVAGLGISGSSVLGPMYIAEIAPASWRGRLVGFFQFNIVFGILLAYLSNYLIWHAAPRKCRVALGAGRERDSCCVLPGNAVLYSSKPALADQEAASRRSMRGA